jgi:hypothetical protein
MKEDKNETKVFIAGSRRLSRLNAEVRERIDKIVEKGLTVIVGDANGADKSVQEYLHLKQYSKVVVFCMEGVCRNNVGNWPTRKIRAANSGRRDFAYFSTKDRAMAAEADYGLMLWDGQSRGTLTNVVHLVRQGKPVVVYMASSKTFQMLRHPDQLGKIVAQSDMGDLQRIDRELQAIEASVNSSPKIDVAQLF